MEGVTSVINRKEENKEETKMSPTTPTDEELREHLTSALIDFERRYYLDHKKLAELLAEVLEGIEMNLQGGPQ